MVDDGWLPITGTDSDPSIGDAEIISIHFRPDGGGLLLELQNLVAEGAIVSQIRFREVRFFQLGNEGVHYLDHIEIFSVSEALNHPEVGPYLRSAFPDSLTWLHSLAATPGLKVYRLMPIAGAETFFVCREAEMRPWRPKPE